MEDEKVIEEVKEEVTDEIKIPVEDTKDESGIEVAGKVKSGELEEDVEVIKENEEA